MIPQSSGWMVITPFLWKDSNYKKNMFSFQCDARFTFRGLCQDETDPAQGQNGERKKDIPRNMSKVLH